MLVVAVIVHVVLAGGSDTSSWVVAGGTLLLAIGTFWMAFKTRQMATETQTLAAETKTGIDAAAIQFRQERMPVLMPVAELVFEDVRVHEVGAEPERPARMPYVLGPVGPGRPKTILLVPVENVGAGPALDVSGSLYFLDQTGARSVGGQPNLVREGVLTAVGPGILARLRFEFSDLPTDPLLPFRLTVSYQDGAGGSYRVTADYTTKTNSYGEVWFEPPEDLRLPSAKKPPPIPIPPEWEKLMPLPRDEPEDPGLLPT